MTLSDSSLSELLSALQAGEVTDKVRTSLEWVLQQLIEAEMPPQSRGDPVDLRDQGVSGPA
jgi:hypothetical protein